MISNENAAGADDRLEQGPKPRKRVGSGLGSGVWTGYAMALLLGGRTLIGLARSLGPVGGAMVLLSVFGGIPLLLGVHSWRERREERARALRRAERAQRAKGRKAPPTAGAGNPPTEREHTLEPSIPN